MNSDMQMHESRDYRFAAGLLVGTVVGAGLAMWFAPRAATEARQRLTHAARNLTRQASAQYQEAGAKVAEAVDEITRKGHEVRSGVAGAVARGADEVSRYATAATSRRST
jgi:gas vesicle protein